MTYPDFLRQIPIFVNLVNADFNRRYLGTYLGIFWAFAAPISTIGVLLFVFNVGFRVAPTNGVSFDLWLTTGLVVWFYVTDSIVSGSNSIVEYSFLVKKIRFPTEILPAVKVFSSLYVHIINMLLLTCLYLYRSSFPNLAWVQLIYYLLALVMFVLAVATISSVILVFFRDFQGVINILMQLGLWGTPILWDVKMIPEKYAALAYLNPANYIVQGYRDAMIYGIWFFDKPRETLYFWIVTLILLVISITLFKRAQRDFADVL